MPPAFAFADSDVFAALLVLAAIIARFFLNICEVGCFFFSKELTSIQSSDNAQTSTSPAVEMLLLLDSSPGKGALGLALLGSLSDPEHLFSFDSSESVPLSFESSELSESFSLGFLCTSDPIKRIFFLPIGGLFLGKGAGTGFRVMSFLLTGRLFDKGMPGLIDTEMGFFFAIWPLLGTEDEVGNCKDPVVFKTLT